MKRLSTMRNKIFVIIEGAFRFDKSKKGNCVKEIS